MSDNEAPHPSCDATSNPANASAPATSQPSAPPPVSAATRYWQGVAAAGRDGKAAGSPQAAATRAAAPQTSAETPVRSRSARL